MIVTNQHVNKSTCEQSIKRLNVGSAVQDLHLLRVPVETQVCGAVNELNALGNHTIKTK
jgi:hypothetical protein